MLKYVEMVWVCQENIKYFFISQASRRFGMTRAVQPKKNIEYCGKIFDRIVPIPIKNTPEKFLLGQGKRIWIQI